jgi:uncharacterized protein YerC
MRGYNLRVMETTLYRFVVENLQRRKAEWADIAQLTGLSVRTIQKIAHRQCADHGIHKMEILAKHFKFPYPE